MQARVTAFVLMLLVTASDAAARKATLPTVGEPLLALAEADNLRAAARGAADLLVASLELAAQAHGRVFDAEGLPADIGYDARYIETWDAVTAAGSPPALVQRIERLPSLTRGAADGYTRMRGATRNEINTRINFRGGEPAIIYARTRDPATLRLLVRDTRGKTMCDQARSSGRVVCRWLPPSDGEVVVRAQLPIDRKPNAISLYTN